MKYPGWGCGGSRNALQPHCYRPSPAAPLSKITLAAWGAHLECRDQGLSTLCSERGIARTAGAGTSHSRSLALSGSACSRQAQGAHVSSVLVSDAESSPAARDYQGGGGPVRAQVHLPHASVEPEGGPSSLPGVGRTVCTFHPLLPALPLQGHLSYESERTQ